MYAISSERVKVCLHTNAGVCARALVVNALFAKGNAGALNLETS